MEGNNKNNKHTQNKRALLFCVWFWFLPPKPHHDKNRVGCIVLALSFQNAARVSSFELEKGNLDERQKNTQVFAMDGFRQAAIY